MTEISNFSGLDLQRPPAIADGVGVVTVPAVVADAATLRGFGRIVTDFGAAQPTIVTWPQQGWRKIVDGTGNEAGWVEDRFLMERRGEIQYATNYAVGRSYVIGWFADPGTASAERAPADTRRIYTHEANYHPDGGQIFFPRDRAPFVALLAKAGDEVTPRDFIAFYCDGSFGLHVDPGVWHQPMFPLAARAEFDDRQGRIHACVAVDFVAEFGCYLSVPLAA